MGAWEKVGRKQGGGQGAKLRNKICSYCATMENWLHCNGINRVLGDGASRGAALRNWQHSERDR